MSRKNANEDDIIQMTIEIVRSFYNRKQGVTIAPMSKDFMWIGACDFQWCEGLEAFIRVTEPEFRERPVLLSDEEYHLLLHERNIWVVYGRYKATAELGDGSVLHAHVRGTYVWRRIKGEMKLVHIHGSNAQDIPLNRLAPPPNQPAPESGIFDYLKHMEIRNTADTDTIAFRTQEGTHRFFFPDEILYLKGAGQYSKVTTKTDCFLASGILAWHAGRLPSYFQRIQKSYIVNLQYVDTIYRYKAVLKDGQELPIGRERYMDVKRSLYQKS